MADGGDPGPTATSAGRYHSVNRGTTADVAEDARVPGKIAGKDRVTTDQAVTEMNPHTSTRRPGDPESPATVLQDMEVKDARLRALMNPRRNDSREVSPPNEAITLNAKGRN